MLLTLSVIPESLTRLYYGESRDKNISDVQNLINSAILYVNKNKGNESTRIRQSLMNSVSGLKNMQQTYSTDTRCVAQIKVVMDQIEDFVQDSSSPSDNTRRVMFSTEE